MGEYKKKPQNDRNKYAKFIDNPFCCSIVDFFAYFFDSFPLPLFYNLPLNASLALSRSGLACLVVVRARMCMCVFVC